MKTNLIKSPLNYTGGKTKLLPQILPLFPDGIDTFYDLFCGGANVGINVHAKHVVYNDCNEYLINLFKTFKKHTPEQIINRIDNLIDQYGLSESNVHGYEYYGCESANGLGKYNKTPYMKLRGDFNSMTYHNDEYCIQFYTLIIFAFNNQIRFNKKGQFNMPVGKRDFNANIRRNLTAFLNALHAQRNVFLNHDFRKLHIDTTSPDDFVYCDPPYLISTASYNEQDGWTETDETDLLNFLDKLNEKQIRFALSNVLTHKDRTNEKLLAWSKKYRVHDLSFNYDHASYHSKKTGNTREVLITNLQKTPTRNETIFCRNTKTD